jgi:long-chain acyl-CoA synthetase
MAIMPPPRGANPFDDTGVQPDTNGVRRYPNLHESLVEMLSESAHADPHAEALVQVGGERITYTQLWDRAARVAGGLREAGISPGDRVAIRLPNSIDWVVAFFGGLMAGAVVVPVNTRFTEAEAAYIIGDSGSSYVFAAGSPLPDARPLVHEGARRSDVAAIFYTSGTTGFPKGAMHTHENVLANVETVYRVSDIPRDAGREMRTLVVVPLFHVTGCHSQTLPALRIGGAATGLPGRGWRMASGSPSAPPSPRSCRTNGLPSTRTRSASRRRTPRSRSIRRASGITGTLARS